MVPNPDLPPMGYGLDYVVEKLGQAVWHLTTGVGDARSRVAEAYHSYWTIPLADFPADVHEHLLWIEHELRKRPARDEFVIADNLRKMKNRSAAKIAERILWVYAQLLVRVVEDPKAIPSIGRMAIPRGREAGDPDG